jgi:hypothetical protein
VGTAVYTANFTPSTTPLTAIANTRLLTCQSNRFVDNSTNAFAITRNGDTAVRALQPFALTSNLATYGSGYFDGAGDYLTAACPSMSGTWTVELWWYPTVGGVQQTFVSFNSGGVAGINIWMNPSNQIVVDDGQVASGLFTGGTFTINAWNHVAIVRNGTTTTSYINGVSVGSNTFTPASVNAINIGRYNGGSFYYVNGYISNLRVVVGTAVYTSAFTPPTSLLTAITNTALLTTQYSGASNNNAFKDSSTNNFPITRNGNATQGTFSPFGNNWSLYTNGTNSYASVPYSATRAIGTGDFSIECWVNVIRQPANYSRIFSIQGGWGLSGNYGIELAMQTIGSNMEVVVAIQGTTVYGSNAILSPASNYLNKWNHVVITRFSGVIRVFNNGIITSSAGNTTNINGTLATTFGSSQAPGDFTEMYISNFRMCIGSVPTASFGVGNLWFSGSSTSFTPAEFCKISCAALRDGSFAKVACTVSE